MRAAAGVALFFAGVWVGQLGLAPAGRRLTQLAGPAGRKLVFEDSFDTLDFKKWKHEITAGGGGNWEFEYYLNNRSNSYVRNGTLFLRPTLTSGTVGEAQVVTGGALDLWGGQPADQCTSNAFFGCQRTSDGQHILNPIQSARLRTAETFSFKYGVVEVEAKLPRGDWIWPAIWLLPTDQAYGLWPASGEIDLVESRGNAAGYAAGGVDEIGSTLHWGPFFPDDKFNLTHKTYKLPSGDFASDFHTFRLEWTADYVRTFVDGTPVLDVEFDAAGFWAKGGWSKNPGLSNPWAQGAKAAPFDQQFYLILNVAVGGTNPYFPDGVGGKCWSSTSQTAALDFWNCREQWLPTWKGEDAAMQVRSVKVWQ